MQLLSLAALGPGGQQLLEELSHKLAHDFSSDLIVFAAITLALWIAAALIAAQAVVKEKADFGNALATGFRWFTGFFSALLIAGAAFYFARLRGSGAIATASILIGVLLIVYTAVNTPMQVYKITLPKAFVFAVIGIVVHLAAQAFVQKQMNDPLMLSTRFDQARRLAALPQDEAAELLTTLRKPAAPAVVAKPTPAPVVASVPAPTPMPAAPPPKPHEKTIAERHDELKKVYADLMARRELLKEGDDAALAAYTRDSADYSEKLAQLQKDADDQKK